MSQQTIKQDPVYDIARNFIKINFSDLPHEIIDVTKKEILDTTGVAFAGSAKPGIQELLEVLKSLGGNPQSSVILANTRLPVIHAAQINASMTHALDYDDTVDVAAMHPGCVIIPSCLAVAEYRGSVSGKEFITAVALGVDFVTRMGLATKYSTNIFNSGWHLTPLYGYLAAAAVTGKLLGFDEEKMVNAIGIGYHQSAGNLQGSMDGTLNKRMGPGFAVRGGIMAALMAQKGITGTHNCLEGKCGMFNQYHHGAYDRQTLLQDLGKHFAGIDLTIKPYPCCRGLHPYIDAALALAKENDIKPEQVKEITVYYADGVQRLCNPIEVKANPRNMVDTQFSVPWGVAVAIANRKVSMTSFTPEAITDKRFLKLTNKTKVEYDATLTRPVMEPGRLKITTDKSTFVKQIDHPLGGPGNPMSFEEVVTKFRDCASYAIKPLTNKTVDSIIGLISKLEDVQDVNEVIELLR